jgi:tetratricopeptide (TPR) repeat protein
VSYQDWPLARSLADVWPQALLLAALLAASAALVARRSWIGFAGAAFFLVLAPSSSVVPVVSELAAEHRMYLPLASVVAVVTATAAWALRRAAALLPAGPGARAAPVAALGVAAALGIATHARNSDYRTSAALWSDAVEKRPRNPVAHAALGYAVEQEGDPLRAVEEYRIAIALDPGYAEAWLNLAFALRTLGRHGEAAEAYATARRLAAPAAHRRAGR